MCIVCILHRENGHWFISCVPHLLTDMQLALGDFPYGLQINFCVSSDLSRIFSLHLHFLKSGRSLQLTLVRVGLKLLHPSNALCMCLSVSDCRFESSAMLTWWFGMVVRIPGIPLWKGLLLGGAPKINPKTTYPKLTKSGAPIIVSRSQFIGSYLELKFLWWASNSQRFQPRIYPRKEC